MMAVVENGVRGFRVFGLGFVAFWGVFGSGVAEAACLLVVTIAVCLNRSNFFLSSCFLKSHTHLEL